MDTLFLGARLIDPETGSDRIGALRVREGAIRDIIYDAAPDQSGAHVIDGAGLCLAPGLVDIGVKICEPGERHKESFRTAGMAAAAGGVTTVVTRPDTLPAIDTPEALEFQMRRATEAEPVRIAPMAALTKGRDGREMTEIGFLQDAGAVAFTDCDRVVENTKVFARCLSYAKSLGALVMAHVQEPILSRDAAATSGARASRMGLSSVSPIAERIALDRDIALVEMTGAAYHADQITTARALPTLRRAKDSGLDVTAGVSIHHLTLTEADIEDYRTFFKVKPPLRAEEDRQAVLEALRAGLIDTVSSMHTPQDEESKRLPFEEAASGAVGLETFLPVLLRIVEEGALSLPQAFRAAAFAPAARLGLPGGRLAPGAPADLVLFDPSETRMLDRYDLKSKSKNTPFDGTEMPGRVIGTWIAGKRVFNAEASRDAAD
ncbi:MAG: dihydroorotase [Pseudomonadota bacterium]